MSANGPSASASAVGNPEVVRDSYIPVFDGKPSSYREYRQRLVLYYKKMKMNKKPIEATINLLMSLTGAAWREHLADSATETQEGFQSVLDALDKAFKYNDRVEMPRALDKFFYGLFRRPDQTLLAYCSDNPEALREVEKHGIKIPAEVEGWIMLRCSGLTPEQRQLIQSQLKDKFTADRVEEAMYFLLAQDYKSAAKPASRSWFRSTTKPAESSAGWRRYGTAQAAEEEHDWPEDWDPVVDTGFTVNDNFLDNSLNYENKAPNGLPTWIRWTRRQCTRRSLGTRRTRSWRRLMPAILMLGRSLLRPKCREDLIL